MKAVFPYLFRWIGLLAVTSIAESLLPDRGIFRTARIGIGLCYLMELISQISVILSVLGG